MANKTIRAEAVILFNEWRGQGVPLVITSHEAWRLTDGVIGIEGNHSTPHSLGSVALRLAIARSK